MNKAQGLDAPALQRYIETRRAVGVHAERIANISHLLALLKQCDSDTITVCPQVLAWFADQINSDICAVQEQLDGFIYILDAEAACEIPPD